MELILIEPNSSEWEYMWEWLHKHPINKDLEQPSLAMNEGQAWQYMGSLQQGKRVIHQFRHRKHPLTNARKDLSVTASEAFTSEQVVKKFRL